jgi:hypothetical protein
MLEGSLGQPGGPSFFLSSNPVSVGLAPAFAVQAEFRIPKATIPSRREQRVKNGRDWDLATLLFLIDKGRLPAISVVAAAKHDTEDFPGQDRAKDANGGCGRGLEWP